MSFNLIFFGVLNSSFIVRDRPGAGILWHYVIVNEM
ncbi:hypothetical protein CLW00_109149 [Mongoliibacter ruber]|uniref:Uncharacterized protein n=1 Tax=Mongoliibacter ruber TaxID=1750599 RepID=A0A2T0WI20_9BACT|nr:hypothetical protein CLW00_109149 [Mongoliibacter ruber]